MSPEELTDDAKAILLLCGYFGSSASADALPLGTADYARLSLFLQQKNLRPASLLDATVLGELQQGMCPVEIPRLRALMSRGAAMGFAVEGWMNKGLWVLCRSDAAYPQRLKRKFREMAPPILYGAGDVSLLNAGGLAIVGSRSIGTEEETFTSMVANRCACDGIQVVSGGAKGVDQTAMREAMVAGGTVAAALADSLLRKSLQKENRSSLHDRRLVLISTVHPEAGFNVGAAMGRNKLIYALAEFALVVRSDLNKGGTWTGAEEELKRENACPVFIHPKFSGDKVVAALSKMGARSFPELPLGIRLSENLASAPASISEQSPELFSEKPQSPVSKTPSHSVPVAPPSSEVPASAAPGSPSVPTTIFEAVWPLLAAELKSPRTAAELAEGMNLRKPQVEDWLKHACGVGLARKLSKPTRYALSSEQRLL
jgi:predicted Rossmann fold nucleotide-binding protein DprA/Smf involved in DNA uptake